MEVHGGEMAHGEGRNRSQGAANELPEICHSKISGNIAKRFGIIPVGQEGDVTVFLAKEILSDKQIDALQFRLGPTNKFRMAGPEEFKEHRRFFDQLLDSIPELPSIGI